MFSSFDACQKFSDRFFGRNWRQFSLKRNLTLGLSRMTKQVGGNERDVLLYIGIALQIGKIVHQRRMTVQTNCKAVQQGKR